MLCNVLVIITLACLLITVNSAEQFRKFKQIDGVRLTNAHRFIRSLAAEESSCASICLRTADCDSFHYNNNTSSVSLLNCELLMTSATDYDALTPAADWSVYSSLLLMISGEASYCVNFYFKFYV